MTSTYNNFKSTTIRGNFQNSDYANSSIIANGIFDRNLLINGDLTLGKEIATTIDNITTYTDTGGNIILKINNLTYTITPTNLIQLIQTLATQSYVNTQISNLDLASQSYVTTQISNLASQSYVNTQISNLVNSSPSTLDTLNELAVALNNDADFSTTITNLIGLKAPLISPVLETPTFTGSLNLVTPTTFSFLDATSSIQTQLNNCLSSSSLATINSNISDLQSKTTNITFAIAPDKTTISSAITSITSGILEKILVNATDTTLNNVTSIIHQINGVDKIDQRNDSIEFYNNTYEAHIINEITNIRLEETFNLFENHTYQRHSINGINKLELGLITTQLTNAVISSNVTSSYSLLYNGYHKLYFDTNTIMDFGNDLANSWGSIMFNKIQQINFFPNNVSFGVTAITYPTYTTTIVDNIDVSLILYRFIYITGSTFGGSLYLHAGNEGQLITLRKVDGIGSYTIYSASGCYLRSAYTNVDSIVWTDTTNTIEFIYYNMGNCWMITNQC